MQLIKSDWLTYVRLFCLAECALRCEHTWDVIGSQEILEHDKFSLIKKTKQNVSLKKIQCRVSTWNLTALEGNSKGMWAAFPVKADPSLNNLKQEIKVVLCECCAHCLKYVWLFNHHKYVFSVWLSMQRWGSSFN